MDLDTLIKHIGKVNWDMDYEEFSRRIGEPAYFPGYVENSYAMEKWKAWQKFVAGLEGIAPLLSKVLLLEAPYGQQAAK